MKIGKHTHTSTTPWSKADPGQPTPVKGSLGHAHVFWTRIQPRHPSWLLQTFAIYCTSAHSAFAGTEREKKKHCSLLPQSRVLMQQEFKGTIQQPESVLKSPPQKYVFITGLCDDTKTTNAHPGHAVTLHLPNEGSTRSLMHNEGLSCPPPPSIQSYLEVLYLSLGLYFIHTQNTSIHRCG